MAKITIKSIAHDLNLSRNTVSMAFKGDPKVTPETRKKIISYAASMGYTKLSSEDDSIFNTDAPIRILVIRRIDQTAYWDRVINGVSEEAAKYNCIINISVVTQENLDFLQFPIGYSDDIDACLFLHKFGDTYSRKILNNNKIGIFLDSRSFTYLDPILGDVIKSEGRRSVMQLTQSLIKQGMTKIAYLCPYYINAETFNDRYEGYCAAMNSAGIPILPEYVLTSSPYQDKTISFRAALDQLPDLPEAIVCANDDSASKFATILMERGVRVPQDVAITGYDNDEYDAFTPFFTTVECNAHHLGRRLVQQLIWRINHPGSPFETITIASTPIYRKSSQKEPL
ncbi:MAG: LacI family transcriptional regulator [Clostridiales bacterium]|nr:LacI family transcriptional regulator [Clostridiales bacterium]